MTVINRMIIQMWRVGYPECSQSAYCLSSTVLNQCAWYHLQRSWDGTVRPLLDTCYVLSFLIQHLHTYNTNSSICCCCCSCDDTTLNLLHTYY